MARKGLPKSYIKKWGITKKAWREYHAAQARKAKHIGYSRSRTTKSKTTRRKKSNPKRRVRRTGRRKKRRGGKSLQRTVFKWLRIGALLAPAAAKAVQPIPMEKKVWHFMYDYTGFDIDTGSWDIKRMAVGWGPFLGACLATYGIPKLMGILRRI